MKKYLAIVGISLLIMSGILVMNSMNKDNGQMDNHQETLNLDKMDENYISVEEHNQIVQNLKLAFSKEKEEKEAINLPMVYSESQIDARIVYNDLNGLYAYVDNIGFETIGNAWVYSKEDQTYKQLTFYNYGVDPTVKKVMWLNEDLLLMIVGHTYGTVTVGGILTAIDINTLEMWPVIKTDTAQEIIDLVVPDTNFTKQIIVVAHWDENYTDYQVSTVGMDYVEFRELVENKEFIMVDELE